MIDIEFVVPAVICVVAFVAGILLSIARCSRKGGTDVRQTH